MDIKKRRTKEGHFRPARYRQYVQDEGYKIVAVPARDYLSEGPEDFEEVLVPKGGRDTASDGFEHKSLFTDFLLVKDSRTARRFANSHGLLGLESARCESNGGEYCLDWEIYSDLMRCFEETRLLLHGPSRNVRSAAESLEQLNEKIDILSEREDWSMPQTDLLIPPMKHILSEEEMDMNPDMATEWGYGQYLNWVLMKSVNVLIYEHCYPAVLFGAGTQQRRSDWRPMPTMELSVVPKDLIGLMCIQYAARLGSTQPALVKICEGCQQVFHAKRPNQRYCHYKDRCKKRRQRAEKRNVAEVTRRAGNIQPEPNS